MLPARIPGCDEHEGCSRVGRQRASLGLAVVQAAQIAGATRIIAIDLNPSKFGIAKEMGATDCVNPSEHDKPIQLVIVGLTQWGVDYTFVCTGNVEVMRAALVRRPFPAYPTLLRPALFCR